MGSIKVENLGKAYKQYPSRSSRVREWISPTGKIYHEKHWILQDISFELPDGEAVGVVGENGAGKSTLLKMIAGVTQPTTGTIRVLGNVAAMLELGMGFHPEFSGRQNVLMAGQLIGFSIDQISAAVPEIQEFAEIGDYFDRPLRTYSSGMQMRLAFSLATARRPDILIVDEALSVGDAYFRHKSFDRIRRYREDGTTLLIVSHDRSHIQSICDRAILLHQGRIHGQGKPDEVWDFYHAILADKQYQTVTQKRLADGSLQTSSGTREVVIESARLLDEDSIECENIEVGRQLTLEVELIARQDVSRLILGFMIKDNLGQQIYGINTHRLDKPVSDIRRGERLVYSYSFNANMGKGYYSISLAASQVDSHLDKNYQWIDRAIMFHVVNVKHEDFVGCNWLNAQVNIERFDS